MKSTISLAIIITGAIIGGAILLSGGSPGNGRDAAPANNVSVVQGKQVITIMAKGGYSPRASTAKAEMPTILRIKTNGTFDCSSALTIPSINYRSYLPPSGITEIELPPQKSGAILQGLCAMGMFNFQISYN